MLVLVSSLSFVLLYSAAMLTIPFTAQRYDVIVNADAPPGNYWLRAFPALLCDVNKNPSNIKGIIRYDVGSSMDPTTLPWPSLDINCDDETQLRTMEPWVALSPGLADEEGNIDVETFLEDQKYWKWQMNSTSYRGDWGNPTILQVHVGILNFTRENDVSKLERPNEWAYFVIETDFIFAHPIHLHGMSSSRGGHFADTRQGTTFISWLKVRENSTRRHH